MWICNSEYVFPHYNKSHHLNLVSKLSLEYVTVILACAKLLSSIKHTLLVSLLRHTHTYDFSFLPLPQRRRRNLRESRVPEIPTRKYRKFSTSSLSKSLTEPCRSHSYFYNFLFHLTFVSLFSTILI